MWLCVWLCGYLAMWLCGYVCLSLQKVWFETAEATLAPVSYNTSVQWQGYSQSVQQQYKQLITECTVLFTLAQANFTNQTISMQNWCLFKMSGYEPLRAPERNAKPIIANTKARIFESNSKLKYTVLFSLAQVHFFSQKISIQNWFLFKSHWE